MSIQETTASEPAGSVITAAWAIKRALLGLGILAFGIGIVACLLWATIDPDPAEAGIVEPAGISTTAGTSEPNR